MANIKGSLRYTLDENTKQGLLLLFEKIEFEDEEEYEKKQITNPKYNGKNAAQYSINEGWRIPRYFHKNKRMSQERVSDVRERLIQLGLVETAFVKTKKGSKGLTIIRLKRGMDAYFCLIKVLENNPSIRETILSIINESKEFHDIVYKEHLHLIFDFTKKLLKLKNEDISGSNQYLNSRDIIRVLNEELPDDTIKILNEGLTILIKGMSYSSKLFDLYYLYLFDEQTFKTKVLCIKRAFKENESAIIPFMSAYFTMNILLSKQQVLEKDKTECILINDFKHALDILLKNEKLEGGIKR